MHTPDWLFRKSVTQLYWVYPPLPVSKKLFPEYRALTAGYKISLSKPVFSSASSHFSSCTLSLNISHRGLSKELQNFLLPYLYLVSHEVWMYTVLTLYVPERVFKAALFHGLCEGTREYSPHVWLASRSFYHKCISTHTQCVSTHTPWAWVYKLMAFSHPINHMSKTFTWKGDKEPSLLFNYFNLRTICYTSLQMELWSYLNQTSEFTVLLHMPAMSWP